MRQFLGPVCLILAMANCSSVLATEGDPRLDLARFHLPELTVSDLRTCSKLFEKDSFVESFAAANKTSVEHVEKYPELTDLAKRVAAAAVSRASEIGAKKDASLVLGDFKRVKSPNHFLPSSGEEQTKSFMCADAIGYTITRVGFFSLAETFEMGGFSRAEIDANGFFPVPFGNLEAFNNAIQSDLTTVSHERVVECVAASTLAVKSGVLETGVMDVWVDQMRRRIDSSQLSLQSQLFQKSTWDGVVNLKATASTDDRIEIAMPTVSICSKLVTDLSAKHVGIMLQ